jgi:uncharacterized protein
LLYPAELRAHTLRGARIARGCPTGKPFPDGCRTGDVGQSCRALINFFTFLLLLFAIGDIRWWWRAHRRLRRRSLRWFVALFALGQLVGLALLIVGRQIGLGWEDILPRPLLSLIFIWHLTILIPWLIVAASSDLVRLVGRLLVRRRDTEPVAGESGLSRREFLVAASTLAPAIVAGGASLAAEYQLGQFRIRRLEVSLPKLPAALDGMTIAHVSDVHVGRFTRDRVLERIVEATNSLSADLVLMTGDLINMSLRDLPAGIELLRAFHAAHGVFLCEGNHDLFDSASGFRRGIERSGLPLLRGDSATVSIRGTAVELLGASWTQVDSALAETIRELQGRRRAGAFPILLAHHPHAFDYADDVPLTLAGHTHGGQLMLTERTGFGSWMFRYWSGLYRKGERAVVVSNGVGNWFPVRINAPAEIIHLTLRTV